MTRIYLKNELATNVPLDVTMKQRGKSFPKKDFTTKEVIPGKFEHSYTFVDGMGRELSHYAQDYEEETLKDYQPGAALRVVRTEKVGDAGRRFTILQWGHPESAEMNMAPQLTGNSTQVRKERQQEAVQDEHKRREVSICLQAFTKSWIESGIAKTPDEAVDLAKKTYLLHMLDVGSLSNQ